jgi:hypothetical protein
MPLIGMCWLSNRSLLSVGLEFWARVMTVNVLLYVAARLSYPHRMPSTNFPAIHQLDVD